MPTVVVREGDRELWRGTVTDTDRASIGSDPTCDIYLTGSEGIAPLHARLWIRRHSLVLGAVAGSTTVNGQALSGVEMVVREDDAIGIGARVLRARIDDGATIVRTVPRIRPMTNQPPRPPPRPPMNPPPPRPPLPPPPPVRVQSPLMANPPPPSPPVVFANPPAPPNYYSSPDTERNPEADRDRAPSTARVRLAVEPTEAQFLDALRNDPTDDDTRLVYADWLEEQSQKLKAQFLRLQLAEHEDDRFVQEHLRALAPASDAPWRAIVSRPRISKCPRANECVGAWSALTPTDADVVRHCRSCDRDVHYCCALVDVVKNGQARNVVALDVSLPDEAPDAYEV